MAETIIKDRESLLQAVDESLDKYDSKKDLSRTFAVGTKGLTAVLGATVTILLGWKSGGKNLEWMVNAALVAGAVISALSSIDTFFSFSSRWTHYKDICTQLIFLQKDVEGEAELDATALLAYKKRLNNIVVDARKGEVELHKKRQAKA